MPSCDPMKVDRSSTRRSLEEFGFHAENHKRKSTLYKVGQKGRSFFNRGSYTNNHNLYYIIGQKKKGFTLGLFHPTYGGSQFTPFHLFCFWGPILLVNSVKD